MKYPTIFITICVLLVSSCKEGPVQYTSYNKAFFLGENSIQIEGAVFEDYEYMTPASFGKIFVRTERVEGTEQVEGWEIVGTKNGNKFELVLNNSSNGVILSKETIPNEKSSLSGLGGISIARIYFYVDNGYPNYYMPTLYKEPRGFGGAGLYDYFSYYYVYVAEPQDLSCSYKTESNSVWPSITTHYYDFNFDRPGWYKICQYRNRPIKNEAKHYSGKNTYMEIRRPYLSE